MNLPATTTCRLNDTGGVGHALRGEERTTYPRGTGVPDATIRNWLKSDLATAEGLVRDSAKRRLEQHEFDALVGFAFNTNKGGISALGDLVKKGDMRGAATQMLIRTGTKKTTCNPGVFARRTDEVTLMLTGSWKPYLSRAEVKAFATEMKAAKDAKDLARAREVGENVVNLITSRHEAATAAPK